MMFQLSLVLAASPPPGTLLLLSMVVVVFLASPPPLTTVGTQAGVPSCSLHTVHSKVRVDTSTKTSTLLLSSQHTDTITTGQH